MFVPLCRLNRLISKIFYQAARVRFKWAAKFKGSQPIRSKINSRVDVTRSPNKGVFIYTSAETNRPPCHTVTLRAPIRLSRGLALPKQSLIHIQRGRLCGVDDVHFLALKKKSRSSAVFIIVASIGSHNLITNYKSMTVSVCFSYTLI